ncbi:hypothetical protein CSW98_13595 [Vibrio sp. HA2012]|uniref:SiaB family protein kinase n=1 Tax=Vibrio sp. HA2012 TaxID=1971595 RepID=UPI000C2BD85A|nr:SiaB family protein kinase [Vibrio sp. HA2012]PJC85610.1 hypothetical protein CSW98_13595 [Vibrio sp. HA2012]
MRYANLEQMLDEDGIVFLSYGGFLTQTLISGMTEALEKEAASTDLSQKVSNNIFTIFIELSQNIMNYAKTHPEVNGNHFCNKSLMVVGQNPKTNGYYIISRNQIDESDKHKIETRLAEVEGLSKDELRVLYREKRKQNRDTEGNGAGIGFIEVARRCDQIEHYFSPLEGKKYNFTVKVTINK